MKKNLIQKIKCLLCGVLLLVPLFPNYVFADTISSANVVGYSVYYEQQSIDGYTSTSTSYYNYVGNFHFIFEFDESYLGYFTISAYVDSYHYYFGANPPTFGTKRVYASGTYYINGNSCEIVVPAVLVSARNNGFLDDNSHIHENPVISYNYTINSSSVTPMASLSTLDDVVNVLTDISNSVSIDVIDELQNIVTDLGIANNYLEKLSLLERYNIPIESVPANGNWWNNQAYTDGALELLDFYKCIYNDYPIYKLKTTAGNWTTLYYGYIYPDDPIYIVYISPSLGSTSWSNNLTVRNGDVTLTSEIIKESFNMAYPDQISGSNVVWYVNKITATSNITTGRQVFRLSWANAPIYFIPIYIGKKSFTQNISTDFALNWGLTNRYLDTLNIIANGTSASTSSSTDLEDSADDIVQNSITMFNFENQQNQNMNNALQNINTNYDIGSFGSSFLSSANWVRTQFDNITNSTPFGSVLSFSLLLGLALLIIGKVYK